MMSRKRTSSTTPIPTTGTAEKRTPDGDIILTSQDIEELGLEEAPEGAGPSWEDIARSRRPGHG